MSVRSILDANGKISQLYLPDSSTDNPLTANLDCAGFSVIDAGGVTIVGEAGDVNESRQLQIVSFPSAEEDTANQSRISFQTNSGSTGATGSTGAAKEMTIAVSSAAHGGYSEGCLEFWNYDNAGAVNSRRQCLFSRNGEQVIFGNDYKAPVLTISGATAADGNDNPVGAIFTGQVFDSKFNPPQMFVNYNPGATTSTPESISVAAPYETIRTIPLGNTPANHNYFKMNLDFNGLLTGSNVTDNRVKFYLTNTSNGAYNAATSRASYEMPAVLPGPGGNGQLVFEDALLIYYGPTTSNQLFVNYTWAGDAGPGTISFAADITTDYTIEASLVSDM